MSLIRSAVAACLVAVALLPAAGCYTSLVYREVGETIAEIDGPGVKEIVAFRVTRDEVHTNKDGYFIGQATFDPQGVEVGDSDPFPPDGSGDGDLFPDNPSVVNGSGRLFPVEGGGAQCVLGPQLEASGALHHRVEVSQSRVE